MLVNEDGHKYNIKIYNNKGKRERIIHQHTK
jgi:hypothetical protein